MQRSIAILPIRSPHPEDNDLKAALNAIPAYEGLLQRGTSGAAQGPRVLAPMSQPTTSVEQGGSSAALTTRQQPQLRYQMPAQYSRENLQYPFSYQYPRSPTSTPGLIGPIGYDVGK